jgi:hypothetical protein
MTNKIVGFDLDGVLMSNVLYQDDTFSEVNIFRNTFLLPMFIPTNPYILITGRPTEDQPLTLKWLTERNLTPLQVYHENKDMKNQAVYKASVLNSRSDIGLFVESSKLQSDFLRKTVKNTRILHFESLVLGALNEILSSL